MSSKNDREPLADAKRSLAFLTRLPTGEGVTNPEGGLADAAWTFPLVGTFVGACGGFAFWIAHAAGLAPTLSGLAAVGAACLLTGCLHEDGLADVADGFGGGSDHDSKLAIMRDSRIGAYGVIALCTSVLARVLALAAFVDAAAALAALLAAGALSRAAIVPVMAGLPPARTDGMSSFAGRPAGATAASAVIIGAVVAVLAVGLQSGLLALVVAMLSALGMAYLARRQIGGQTGDVLGATAQVAEGAVLIVLSIG
jgi:adenosylcobinamide-GDP ribazoletransferase